MISLECLNKQEGCYCNSVNFAEIMLNWLYILSGKGHWAKRYQLSNVHIASYTQESCELVVRPTVACAWVGDYHVAVVDVSGGGSSGLVRPGAIVVKTVKVVILTGPNHQGNQALVAGVGRCQLGESVAKASAVDLLGVEVGELVASSTACNLTISVLFIFNVLVCKIIY